MTPGERPESWQLLVLAYVDGELDPVSRLEVEAWMRTQPEVAELVRELCETSRRNRAFRREAALPEPDPAEIRLSGEVILARLRLPNRYRGWLRPAILSAAAASMAGMLVLACPKEHVCENAAVTPPAAPPDPLAEYDDLPIASPGEARVSAIRGDVSPMFVACDDPLPDVLDLATVDEVRIERSGRSAFSVPAPGDAPMIFQTRAK